MNPTPRWVLAVALFLLGSALFAAAYCQSPLYYSNQNQYFLHGLARAGYGHLEGDWLANTVDPTPAFSTLVRVTAEHAHPWAFYAYHALLLGAYGAAMLALFLSLVGSDVAARRWPAFLVLFVLLHSGVARWLSYRVVNSDYVWFFQAGVAGQYVLGAMLQPSVFGVLLVVAIALFANDRPYLAGVSTGLAGAMHSTYFLPGALLTLGFLTSLLVQRRMRDAVGLGALALLFVLPAVIYAWVSFRPTSAEDFALAGDILVNLRIPHHSRTDLWLDTVAMVQLGGVVVAILLVWRTPLFLALLVPSLFAALLTVAQAVTKNESLALLFPWRISAVLGPIATTIVLARLLQVVPLEGAVVRAVSLIGVGLLVAGGVWISYNREAFRSDDDELPMLEFVRGSCASGDVYLIPVRVPELVAATRGSLSSDFKPLAQKKGDSKIIPIDLQRFRLHARAPIYVDFKSIPYKDTDVIAWRERLFRARDLYKTLAAGRAKEVDDDLRRLNITHVVVQAGTPIAGLGWELLHEDPAYRVYRIPAKPSATP